MFIDLGQITDRFFREKSRTDNSGQAYLPHQVFEFYEFIFISFFYDKDIHTHLVKKLWNGICTPYILKETINF